MPPKTDPKTSIDPIKSSSPESKTMELVSTVGNQTALALAKPISVPPQVKLYLYFKTDEQRKKHLDSLSLLEIQQLSLFFSNKTLPFDVEIHQKGLKHYLELQYQAIKEALDDFSQKHNYIYKAFQASHALFGHSFITLYPQPGNPHAKAHMRETIHRPILDIELVGRKLYARCYLGLYAPAKSGSHKDITADESGKVHLNHVNQMNLGNPFKAMLWAEDYLVNASHYKNDSTDEAPHPVVRTFLVPLEQAGALLSGEGAFGEKTRPVDQDRASGQFSNTHDPNAYDDLFTPLDGSLVSFFYSHEDFYNAPVKGQVKYSMEDLVEFLTGTRTDLKAFGSDDGQWSAEEALSLTPLSKTPPKKAPDKSVKLPPYPKKGKPGIAAQYGRSPNDIVANSAIRDYITAYYDSITDTGFSAATSIASDRRSIAWASRPCFGGRTTVLNPYIMNLVGITEQAQLLDFLQAYSLLPKGSVKSPTASHSPESSGESESSDPLHMHEPQKVVFPPELFNLTGNPGRGDCLFHALEGHTLNHDDLIRIRTEVAGVRLTMVDTQQEMGLNAQVVAMNLLPIPIIGDEVLDLIQGHHLVPNRLLAQLQAIPGVYAGDTEILQWTQLRHQNVYVLENNGTFIHFTPDGTQRRLPPPTLAYISELLTDEQNVLLYKYPNHWVRCTGVAASLADGLLEEEATPKTASE